MENPQNPSLVAGNKYNLLKKEYDQLKEEMFRLETAKDDCRIRAEIQERELVELQSRIEELQIQADEARHLKVTFKEFLKLGANNSFIPNRMR